MFTDPLTAGLCAAAALVFLTALAVWSIAHARGHARGYARGHLAGHQAGLAQGRDEGHRAGYTAGLAAARGPRLMPAGRPLPARAAGAQSARRPSPTPRTQPAAGGRNPADSNKHARHPQSWRPSTADGRRWKPGVVHTAALPAISPATETTR